MTDLRTHRILRGGKTRCSSSMAFVAASMVTCLSANDARAALPAPQPVVVLSSPTVEGGLASIAKLATSSFLQELEQVAHLTTVITNLRTLIKASNEVHAVLRVIKKTYDVVRNYSLDDYLIAAKEQLYDQFPEMAQLDREVRIAHDNFDGFFNGGDAYFSISSYHDTRVEAALSRAAFHAAEAKLVGRRMRDNEQKRRKERITDAEKLVEVHFSRAGLGERRVLEGAAAASVAKQLQELVGQAEDKQRLDLALLGVQAETAHETMLNTKLLREAKEAEIARAEAQRLQAMELDKKLRDELAEQTDDMFRIGVVK